MLHTALVEGKSRWIWNLEIFGLQLITVKLSISNSTYSPYIFNMKLRPVPKPIWRLHFYVSYFPILLDQPNRSSSITMIDTSTEIVHKDPSILSRLDGRDRPSNDEMPLSYELMDKVKTKQHQQRKWTQLFNCGYSTDRTNKWPTTFTRCVVYKYHISYSYIIVKSAGCFSGHFYRLAVNYDYFDIFTKK